MMRIKKETLNSIIKQEVRKNLRSTNLNESTTREILDPMELIEFAQEWESLGKHVQEQVIDVVDNGRNAVGVRRLSVEKALLSLGHFNETLEQYLQEWIDADDEHINDSSDSFDKYDRRR